MEETKIEETAISSSEDPAVSRGSSSGVDHPESDEEPEKELLKKIEKVAYTTICSKTLLAEGQAVCHLA